jgi:hypothetical protein
LTVFIVVVVWIAICLAFLAGCCWNSGAYDRGYRDGRDAK